jgi:hypothetical protein
MRNILFRPGGLEQCSNQRVHNLPKCGALRLKKGPDKTRWDKRLAALRNYLLDEPKPDPS